MLLIELFKDPLAVLPLLAVLLAAFTVHEFSHALSAYWLGDDTAKRLGRLTLNPIAHLDPIGTLSLLIGFIGWGKPVPVSFHNLRRPRQDGLWIAAAGPASNIAMALVLSFLMSIFPSVLIWGLNIMPAQAVSQGVVQRIVDMAYAVGFWGIYINLVLAFFNLLPFYPLDGEKIVLGLAPQGDVEKILAARQYGMYFVLGIFGLSYFFNIHIVSYVVEPVASLLSPEW